jgi:hypothetical protein
VWFFKSLGAGPCAAAGPGPVLTGGASPSENSPVARAVRRLGGVDDGNGGPDDGCEVLAKVTRSRWLRRGLDVADAALTHLGVGAPMRLIARAGGATLGTIRSNGTPYRPMPSAMGSRSSTIPARPWAPSIAAGGSAASVRPRRSRSIRTSR